MLRTIPLVGLVLCLAVSGCEDDPPPTTRADAVTAKPTLPSAEPSAAPGPAPEPKVAPPQPVSMASASASPTPAPSAEPASTLAQIGTAAKVTLRRFGETGGVGAEAELSDPKTIDALRSAIDVRQTPSEACPRCVATVQLAFHDAFATRLGTIGLFCSGDDTSDIATVRDALANQCTSIKLKDPTAVRKIVDDALAP